MKNFLHGFALILFAIATSTAHGAVAANDVILTQRNSGNTSNIQSPVTATANAVMMFNATLVPVSKTLVAGDNITISQNATAITINSTASGTGNVTTTGATANAVMLGNGTTAIAPIASLGTSGFPLVSAGAGAPPAFSVLTVPGGGTGVGTITTGAVVLGNGTGAVTSVAAGTSGNVLTSDGSAWVSSTPASGGNVTNNASLTNATFVIGNGSTGIGTTTVAWNASNSTITVGTAGAGNIIANVVTLTNLTVTDLNATNLTLTNPVSLAAGGTGITSTTKGNIILGNNATTYGQLGVGADNKVLMANSSATYGVSWETVSGSGNVTNAATLTDNRIVLGNGTTSINVMASAGTSTTVLHGNAAGAPTFAAVSLTADVSGTLPLGNGGTGFSTTTAGNVIIGNNTTTYGQLGVGANGTVLTSNTSAPLKVSWEAPTGGATAIARTAWVEVNGNNTTGAVGDITKPYATIDGALAALGTSDSTAKIIRIGTGRFAPMSGAVTGNATGNNYSATSIVYNNTKFYGSGTPKIKSDFTTLEDGSGTIIDGPFGVDNTGIEVRDLGIDSGSAVCTARYSGSAVDGLDLYNQGQVASPGTKPPRIGCIVSNVVVLCKDRTSSVHAALLENLDSASVSNLQTMYGTHGIVFKTIRSTATGLRTDSHELNAVLVKSNPYAPCYANSISNIVATSVGSAGGAGLHFDSSDTSATDIVDVAISGVVLKGLDSGIEFTGGASASLKRIGIRGVIYDTVTTESSSTGTIEKHTVSINGVSLKTNPTLLNSWANYGSGNPDVAWWIVDGAVCVEGVVAGGTVPSYVFNLPADVVMATPKRVVVPCYTGTFNTGDVLIDSTGLYFESGVPTVFGSVSGYFPK